jgi:hypothetical protein
LRGCSFVDLVRRPLGEGGFQPVDQLRLRRVDLVLGAWRVEPFAPVHLREGQPPPRPRGHSARIGLLLTRPGSASPSHAQAWTSLPAFWRTLPSGTKGPSGRTPVSSSNSRTAAAKRSSPSSTRPFGRSHAPNHARCRTARRGGRGRPRAPSRNGETGAARRLRSYASTRAHEWSAHGGPRHTELCRLYVGRHALAASRLPTCRRSRSQPE